MATCPRCKGPLGDTHQCPRRRVSLAAQDVALGLAGGISGLMVLALADPGGHAADMDLFAFGAGALLLLGAQRTFRSR